MTWLDAAVAMFNDVLLLATPPLIIAQLAKVLSVDLRRPPDIGIWREDYSYLNLTASQLCGLYDPSSAKEGGDGE